MSDATYDADVIRINSQSGKGGVGYILETALRSAVCRQKMREAMGYAAKGVSDVQHKELQPEEIFQIFKKTFEHIAGPLKIEEIHYRQEANGGMTAMVDSVFNGEKKHTECAGNGRLNAVSNALKEAYGLKYNLVTYQEHALEQKFFFESDRLRGY